MSNEIRVSTMKLNQQWASNSWFPSAVYSVTPTTLLLSLSHPRLLRRQSSRIESKIQKLGRRVGHTLFGVNESCRASESEHPPPPSNLAPGAHWHGHGDPVFSVYSRSGEENPLAPPETRAHVLSRGSSSSCFRESPKRGGNSLSENYSSTFEKILSGRKWIWFSPDELVV